MRKLALVCEGRLKESDQRYKRLVESLDKSDPHPKKSGFKLFKAKTDCKQVNGELEIVNAAIAEKERAFKQLSTLNKRLGMAWNVRNSYAEDDVKKLLKVPRVEFDRFTEHSTSSLAKVFWLCRESEAKAGAMIVSKMRECMTDLVKECKSTQKGERSGDTGDIIEFGDFLTRSLGKWVNPEGQQAFYQPQRRDHDGKPIKQKGKGVREEVEKVKLAISGVKSKRLQSKNPCGSYKVQDLKTSSMVMRK